ncbi:bifunctional glycosyltransferase family 2 protein/CDP-glycerol:glycerophosphate glycerophosphotransferase [Mobilitalea sibirica]|uniref:Bifunctional glycosyltransferase family 2 protein/CDP-glycerol:glycerophosphate glycerophosphotransferase n=1 Tax=Mobilitalea sibirica TaxID=1462919 RepID=A0A8J7KSJ9_9FIRM|nr:bifunctional glycosyltransferase family 2 protein/CDP-glycerol:glycerophosphate glycerophosphotransferase [Mobilitalea sibirica]MBH1940371.1 bifunctional glycosyltransferase family 2 protein/CDP-glycerol:glycerophosphate glycerophosphotransferase [Mobilitalea sibirica]
MKVSVIVPYHEEEAYLRDCLDSLVEQSYRDIEILLICDRVRENALTVLSDYQAKLDIKVHHLKDKKGVAAARNLGLDMANGEYVYFMDSDDYLYGDTLENLVVAAQDRDDDIIYGKKKPTWFQRSVYLAMNQENDSEDIEEEDDDSSFNSAELNMENGEDGKGSYKDSTDEDDPEDDQDDNDYKDDSDDSDDNDDKQYKDESKGQKNDSRSEDDEDEKDIILSENELQLLREKRTRQAYRILVSKRKGVRNISVLNILFKRSFIEDNKLRFPEHLVYFSDMPFLIEALANTDRFKKRLSAKYIKRKHNDTINNPSLSQIKDPNRFYEFLDAYYEAIKRIPRDSDLRNRLDRKYISYYAKNYAPRLKRSKNDAWRTDNFVLMSDIMKGMNPEVINSLKGYKKRLIKALIKKDVNKSIKIVKMNLARKKIKRILKNKKAFAKFLYVHYFIKKPLKDNWVIFESFFGKSYSDSPKYVYEYLAKNYPGQYKFIWVINKRNTKIPYKHKKIKRFGIRYSYYLARCKYFVFNGRQPEWVKKRPGSVFLQTWHGTPLKKLVFDIEDVSSATPKYKQQVYKQSRAWDYLIAPNAFCSETFRRCFMFEKKMLETGYPRNDILHSPDKNLLAGKIRKKLSIPKGKKVILYAPTWRDDEFYAKGKYKFELHLNLDLLKQELGEDYVILIRTHYFIADSLDVSALKGFAYNVSKYDDISELYLISDILITDYSSVFFDYAGLKRPMLFFTYDLDKYRDVLRGFYIDIEREVPGPLLFTSEDVINAIHHIDEIQDRYHDRYEKFYQRFCAWEDGHASEKVVKSVFGK